MKFRCDNFTVWHWGISLCLWGASLYGALSLRYLPGNWGHGICGPWGCGPTLQALVAYHTFWLMLLIPPAIAVACCLDQVVVRRVGLVLMLLGGGAIAAICVTQCLTWLPETRAAEYLPQRCLFCIATAVDLPAAQLFCVGSALRWLFRPERLCEKTDDSPGPEWE